MTTPTAQQLETSLKSTLHSLSLIISFYTHLQALSAVPYASRAPRHLVQKLRDESKAYEEACNAIETKVLRAIAVIERDLRKSQGLLAPVSSTSTATGLEPGKEESDASLSVDPVSLADAGETEKPTSSSTDDKGKAAMSIDLDTSFLHTSLFGDSAAPSPISFSLDDAEHTSASLMVPDYQSPTISNSPLAIGTTPAAPSTHLPSDATTAAPVSGIDTIDSTPPDLASMLSMLNSGYPTTSTSVSETNRSPKVPGVDTKASTGDADLTNQLAVDQDLDVDSIISNLSREASNAGVYGEILPNQTGNIDFSSFASGDMPGISEGVGIGEGGMGLSTDSNFNLAMESSVYPAASALDSEMDFGTMEKLDLEELLRSLGDGAAAASSAPPT